jgi:hypothetical protein
VIHHTVYGPVDDTLPRIQDIRPTPYYCGILLCTGCGATVAQCGCGRQDFAHFCDSCPACAPEAPAVWVHPSGTGRPIR